MTLYRRRVGLAESSGAFSRPESGPNNAAELHGAPRFPVVGDAGSDPPLDNKVLGLACR